MSAAPPTFQNLEAEQAFLGALLSNNGVLPLVTLEAADFSEPVHSRIFEAAASLINAGRLASPVMLKNHFEADKSLVEIGGTAYLARLAASATSIINAPEYARQIRDLALRRRLSNLVKSSADEIDVLPIEISSAQFAADLSAEISQLAMSGDEERTRFSLKEALACAIDQTALAYQNEGKRPDAISTGIAALDTIIGGLVAETLVILAARPSMGKTSLAAAIAYNAARSGSRTDFYSLDMTVSNLAQRIASIETRVPYERMQWGRVSEAEFTAFVDAAEKIAALPMTIIVRGGMSLAMVGAEIAKGKMRNPDLFLIVLDQLSQISIGGKFIAQRMGEVAAITAGLKALAIRYKVCIVLVHQLSRAADVREGNRPQLSDLRDSGSLEQDANVVLFPFREEYYLTKNMPKENTPEFTTWQHEMRAAKNVMEIIVAKNSMGRVGSARTFCDLPINEITDIAESATAEMF